MADHIQVLDGNINPQDYYFRSPEEDADDIDKAFDNFFDLCAEDEATNCAWETPEGSDRTGEVLLQKFADWVGLDPDAADRGRSSDSPLNYEDSYRVRSAMKTALKAADELVKLSQVLQYFYDCYGALQRYREESMDTYTIPAEYTQDGTCPSVITQKRENFDPSEAKPEEDEQDNALYGVTCSDNRFRIANPDEDDYRDLLQKYLGRSKYAGDAATSIIFTCLPWITESDDQDFQTASQGFGGITTSPNPILYVQTKYDPVTPLASGNAASGFFPNSQIYVSEGMGVSILIETLAGN